MIQRLWAGCSAARHNQPAGIRIPTSTVDDGVSAPARQPIHQARDTSSRQRNVISKRRPRRSEWASRERSGITRPLHGTCRAAGASPTSRLLRYLSCTLVVRHSNLQTDSAVLGAPHWHWSQGHRGAMRDMPSMHGVAVSSVRRMERDGHSPREAARTPCRHKLHLASRPCPGHEAGRPSDWHALAESEVHSCQTYRCSR